MLITNEDDCSAPPDSTLFDPSQFLLADPLGGLSSYRCNEFGHLCGGVAPPHQVSGPTTLQDCVPAETAGRLTPVGDFVAFLRQMKADQSKVFFAALAAPPTPYVVDSHSAFLPNGGMEDQPEVEHSCVGTDATIYGDPAVRISSAVTSFGDHGRMESICGDLGAQCRRHRARAGANSATGSDLPRMLIGSTGRKA